MSYSVVVAFFFIMPPATLITFTPARCALLLYRTAIVSNLSYMLSIEVYALLRFIGPLACHQSMEKALAFDDDNELYLQRSHTSSNTATHNGRNRQKNVFSLANAIKRNLISAAHISASQATGAIETA